MESVKGRKPREFSVAFKEAGAANEAGQHSDGDRHVQLRTHPLAHGNHWARQGDRGRRQLRSGDAVHQRGLEYGCCSRLL